MAEESAQEKTEDPTPKRLEKALEDGQVLTSKELFVFSTLFTGFLMYFLILMFSDRILGEFKGFFSFDLSDFQGELLLRIRLFESHSHFLSIANPPRPHIPPENSKNPHFSKNPQI